MVSAFLRDDACGLARRLLGLTFTSFSLLPGKMSTFEKLPLLG